MAKPIIWLQSPPKGGTTHSHAAELEVHSCHLRWQALLSTGCLPAMAVAQAIHAIVAVAVCFTRAPRASRCPETLPARAGVTVRGQCWTCSAVLQPAQTAISRGRQDERAKLMVSLRTPRARSTARLDRYPTRLTPSSLPPRAQILIWGDAK